MAELNEMYRWQTRSAGPLQLGEHSLTLQSQALTLGGPFGGLVWNRPAAVLVEGPDGTTRRLPIVDVTRVAQLGMWGLGLVFLLIAMLVGKERSK